MRLSLVFFLAVLLYTPDILFAQAPTNGASNFTTSNNDGDRLRVNWSRGNGARVLVIGSISATFNGTGIPTNGIDYNANATLGSGDPVGAGNFVVFDGAGTSVVVNGLSHSTTYYFRIFEYNGVDAATAYNTANLLEGNGSTLFLPTVGSSAFAATTTGNSASLSWTRGNGTRSMVILQAGSAASAPTQYSTYFASTAFGAGSVIGSGSVVHFNSANTVNVTNLQPNTQYFYRIVESNGTSGPVYDVSNALTGSFTTNNAPTNGSTAFNFTGAQGDRVSMSFTAGNGTRRIVLARQDFAVNAVPLDGVDYNASTVFGLGDELGTDPSDNNFVVYEGNGNSLTVTGLTPATTYHFAIFEFNGTGVNTFYLTSVPQVLVGSGSTLSPPSVSAGNFAFPSITGYDANITFTAGNGTRRLVLAKAGSPITAVPVNLVDYVPNSSFPSSPALGDARLVYEGNGTSFTLSALQPNTTYHLAIFEYNGTSGPVYKQSDPGLGSFTTLGKPTVSPSGLTFSAIQGNRMTLNYTSGNGFGRIVIGKLGSPVDVFPTDFTSYTASTVFGSGANLGGGNFVIQNNPSIGTNTTTTVSNLAIGQQYHFAIIEYNGTATERIYMTSAEALTGNSSTLSAPTVQASNLSFTNITSNTLTVNWQNGNGDARIVLIRQGQAVQTLPTDLANYSASSNYGSSPSLGTSRIIYDGTGTSVNVTNIPPGEYHVAVIEYNGTSGSVYRNVDPLIGSVNVGAKPIVPATNLSISGIQGDRMTITCTRGDGLSRMVIVKAGSPVDVWPIDFTGYTANPNFGTGSDLGGGNFVIGFSTSTNFTVTNLVPSSTYHFAIVEVNGTSATAFYQESTIVATASGTTLSAPSQSASSFFANNVTGNSLQLTWTRGNGNGRLIIAKAGSPVDVVPVNLTDPFASSQFGAGSNLGGGNFVVYDGNADNFTLINLQPGTVYHFAAFEYNGTGTGKVYLTASSGVTSFSTLPRPTLAAKNLNVSNINGDRITTSFTLGNGTRRLIVVKKGGLVSRLPVDFTTYTIGAFGVGSDLGDGNFVVNLGLLNGTFIIQGLEPNAEYGVAVFELDGAAGNERYLTTSFINQMVSTSITPTIATESLLYNSVGSTSINLSWTSGNGQGRMVVVRPFQPVTFQPTNLNTHGSNSTNYASTTNVLPNGHKHIDRDNITTVTITNLAPGTTYHVAIYEYNGTSQPVYISEPLRGFFTTLPTSGLAIGGFDAITFCPAQQVDIPYVFTGVLNAGNIISVELSDISGSFASPLVLGSQSTTNATGFVTSTLPVSLSEGIGYRLRVRASNPNELSADNGADLQIVTSVQPSFTVVGGQVTSCGTPITLSTSQPGYNVQWFRDTQLIPDATTSTYQALESGSYQVRITGASGGCALFSSGTSLTIAQAPTFDFQFPTLYCEGEVTDLVSQTTPVGGSFSGAGVSTGSFNSVSAGVGQHLLQYTYVDAVSSCSYFETRQVQVLGIPSSPTVSDASICEGSAVVLTASGAVDGDYRWYTAASGGTAIAGAVNSTLVTPILNANATYYAVISDGVCESSRMPVNVTVMAVPAAPLATGATVCDNGALTLTASGGSNGQYRWYTISSGGSALTGEVNDTFTTPTLSTSATYYVSLNNGTCESSRTPVLASVLTTPAPPVTTDASACGSSAVVLTASGGIDGNYNWYENETGGTALAGETAATFTTPILTSNITYYVSLRNGNCWSTRTPLSVVINTLPAQPLIQLSGATEFCSGETLTLTAPLANGYLWSTGETTQSISVATAGSFTVSVTDANGCTSQPSEPVVTTVQNCNNQAPLIDTAPLSTQVGSQLIFNLLVLLTDPDDNLDLSTLQIISQPESGAVATLDNGSLLVDYANISFTGTDRIVIQVCDLAGSCTQQTLEIEVVGDVEIYNAVSPNGDGLNDVFIIQYISSIPETLRNKVTIYNRWGDEVFSVSDYDNDQKVFKGLSNSGKELPTGTYFYKIEFNSGRSAKNGYLYLKR